MPAARASLVLTTIFEGPILETYFENFRKYGHLEQTEVILIPDRKTPAPVKDACDSLTARGLCCVCPSLEEQEAYLRRAGIPPEMIPYDSDNRRNVGYLMALESGTDFLITIDDDNYCVDSEDFFAAHSVVAQPPAEHDVAASSTGFLNICDLLEYAGPARVYPRGFPYVARHKPEQWQVEQRTADIHMNAGLWLRDPDVDAITWLVGPVRVSRFKGPSLTLAADTWAPVNSQNSALRRDAIAAYYFVRMGYNIAGISIDRFGDIFSGYFTEACAKHLGGSIRFGSPVAEHRRNSHNYMKDAVREWACVVVLEDMLPWMRETRLSGSSYAEAYLCLSHLMQDAVERFQGPLWTDGTRAYFHQMAYHMRLWLKACRAIGGC